jgi:hypothetical protein
MTTTFEVRRAPCGAERRASPATLIMYRGPRDAQQRLGRGLRDLRNKLDPALPSRHGSDQRAKRDASRAAAALRRRRERSKR